MFENPRELARRTYGVKCTYHGCSILGKLEETERTINNIAYYSEPRCSLLPAAVLPGA